MRGLFKGRETEIDECKHQDNSNLILKNIGAQNFKREEENLYRSFKTGFDHFLFIKLATESLTNLSPQ